VRCPACGRFINGPCPNPKCDPWYLWCTGDDIHGRYAQAREPLWKRILKYLLR
jgi:hypothetical protein